MKLNPSVLVTGLSAVALIWLLSQVDNSLAQMSDRTDSPQRIGDIDPPDGFVRVPADANGFGVWLRELALKPDSSRVRLYDGRPKEYQGGQYRVIDLDIGDTDLLQCADAAMRLRAEYLLAAGRSGEITFDFTSGDNASYSKWIAGWRPIVRGNDVNWVQRAGVDSSRATFDKYLKTVFQYCGSYSLARDLEPVANLKSVKPGDCFIQGGFPGHVIMVVDCAADSATGTVAILLAQGFMPAQDIHVLRNLNSDRLNPWYPAGGSDRLYTPEWMFDWSDLYRFPD